MTPSTENRREGMRRYLVDHRGRAVPAIEIATHLRLGGVSGNRETQRRRVRTLARQLREEEGICVCADHHPENGGYWLARSSSEWAAYLEARKSQARFEFGGVRKAAEAVSERKSGQMKMFEQRTPGMAFADWDDR